MTHRISRAGGGRIAALAALVALIAGCKPDSAIGPQEESPLPDLSGEWSYVATEMRAPGSPSTRCDIDGMTLEIGPWEFEGFGGRTTGGEMRCEGDLRPFSGPLPSYPVRRGGMAFLGKIVYDDVAFDISNQNWRHEGKLSHDTVRAVVRGEPVKYVVFGDTMRGLVRMNTGGIELQGSFRAVRLRRP